MASAPDPVRGLSLNGLRRLRTLAAEELVHRALEGQDTSEILTVLRAANALLDARDDGPPSVLDRQRIFAERTPMKYTAA